MIKTEFMELYEELGTINEGIEDIDFKALATAETEAERLRKEIFDLEKEYSNKVRTAVNADEQYNKFRAELSELRSQLRELKRTYERREWFRSGPDEYDHEDWVDEEAYAKVKDRVEELNADIKVVEDKLAKAEANVKQQFEADTAILRDKQAEHKKHTDIFTAHKATLKQAQEEVMPELKAVADYLNEQEGKKVWEVSKTDIHFNQAEGRIIAALYTRFTEANDFNTDDFDYDGSGELKDSVAEDAANDAAEYIGYTADQIIDAFELEQSDEGWYKIPGSAWELSNEGEAFPYETPTFRVTHYYDATYWEPADWDYEEDGEFVVECRLILGKKIK